MDDRKVGAVVRLLRRRRDWRQRDVAERAGVSQQLVSLLEHGHFEVVGLDKARAVAGALDARLELDLRWRGPELDRLLDTDHAKLVGRVVMVLRSAGWEVIVEWTFSHYGERGSVDVVGWHAATASLLVVEVKTSIVDLQELLASVDRKARVAQRMLADERGWRPRAVGRIVVMPGTSTIRDALRKHAAVFAAAFPARTREVRRWVAAPDGRASLSGLWLLRPTNGRGTPRPGGGSAGSRVRRPRSG